MTDRAHSNRPRLTADTTRYARIVGENVAARRYRLGLTQEQLAEKVTAGGIPMTAGVVFFTEKGSTGGRNNARPRNVSVDQLVAFAEVFGCDPMDLLAAPCPTCEGVPPEGFTCNACGSVRQAEPAP